MPLFLLSKQCVVHHGKRWIATDQSPSNLSLKKIVLSLILTSRYQQFWGIVKPNYSETCATEVVSWKGLGQRYFDNGREVKAVREVKCKIRGSWLSLQETHFAFTLFSELYWPVSLKCNELSVLVLGKWDLDLETKSYSIFGTAARN